jgi:hypothetical protein
MKKAAIAKYLVVALLGGALAGSPAQATEKTPGDARAGLDDLSGQLSTCAAYYSLLASVIENASGPEGKAELTGHIRSTSQAMFVQAVRVANHIGMEGGIVAERVKAALAGMVETVNRDPANSLTVMHTRYGQPCSELLESGPQRYAELLKQYGPSY